MGITHVAAMDSQGEARRRGVTLDIHDVEATMLESFEHETHAYINAAVDRFLLHGLEEHEGEATVETLESGEGNRGFWFQLSSKGKGKGKGKGGGKQGGNGKGPAHPSPAFGSSTPGPMDTSLAGVSPSGATGSEEDRGRAPSCVLL